MAILKNNLVKKFSTIPNELIVDKNLSHGAKIVFCYLVSRPDNWEVNNKDIQKQLNIKQAQTLANYWKELISIGWLNRHRKATEKGIFKGGFDYELNDTPIIAKNHNMEKPYLGKTHTHNKTNTINKTDLNNKNKQKELIVSKIEDKGLQDAYSVAYYLHDKILTIKPNFVCRNLIPWVNDLNKAIRIDKRTKQELIKCIDYIYSEKGTFWQPIILSGAKLRAKYDTLEMQAITQQPKTNKNKSVIDAVYEAEQMGAL